MLGGKASSLDPSFDTRLGLPAASAGATPALLNPFPSCMVCHALF